MVVFLMIIFFINNYSFLVLFICCTVLGIILRLKTLLLSIRFYVILLVYIRGVLLILFYFSLILNEVGGMLLNKTTKIFALIGFLFLVKKTSFYTRSATINRYLIERKRDLWIFLWLICFLVLYFIVVLNYYHKIKFLRQIN